jgi:DNA helicase II / ATP-dependent DNA helicase PcrA
MTDLAKTFLESLSEEQSAAALQSDRPVMIIAGAGSGKTRTLIARFVHLVTPTWSNGLGADPSSVMMVTFTNKAAREMRERILPVIESIRNEDPKMGPGEPWIGTFHGLSLRILRVEAARAGLGKNFSIFDESDARSLALEVADHMGLERFDVDQFFRDLEIAKARLLSSELLAEKAEALLECELEGVPPDAVLLKWKKVLDHFQTPDFVQVYAEYQRSLADQNAVDFSDLMNRVTTLFRENEDIRDSWRSTFRHFMVDEVQDINRAQVAWLDAFTGGGARMEPPEQDDENSWASAADGMHEINAYRLRKFPKPTIAFVGDDDQSIYGFRGSDVSVMRSLDRKYPELDVKFLRASYRCQPSILTAANTLVSVNTGRYGKELIPADATRVKSRVAIEQFNTPADEIAAIADEAARHIADGKDPAQFGILVRTRDLVRAVARELRARGLPVTEGKASDIRKSAEVRDAMAFAGFIANPDAETLLRRIANKPSRGLGPTSMSKVSKNARLKNISFIEELRSIMNDRIDLPEEADPYPKAFIASTKDFGRLIVDLRRSIGSASNAGEAFLTILDRTGYLPALKEEAVKSAGVKPDPELLALPPSEFLSNLIRLANEDDKGRKGRGASMPDEEMSSEDLVDRAGQLSETARRIGNLSLLIEQASNMPDLDAFMQEAMLEMDQSDVRAGIPVMTVHASKGLEFDRVRLPFWMEGIIPHARAEMEGPAALEEERRLAYVAITRAREDLRISRSWNIRMCPFIRMRSAAPSRFIDELLLAPRQDIFAADNTKKRAGGAFSKPWVGGDRKPAPAPRVDAAPSFRDILERSARPPEPAVKAIHEPASASTPRREAALDRQDPTPECPF